MTRIMMLAALLALAACASTLEIPPQQIAGTRAAPKPIPARLTLPSGPGPHPVVILLHGCDGLASPLSGLTGMDRWVSRVNGWGYAALVPDSMFPRGVSEVCPAAEQRKVTPTDRSGDVVSAALYLRTLKDIDSNRIAVIGLSHGGATAARLAVAPAGLQAKPLIRATINYYGPCVAPASYTGMPLLALAGEDDDWGNPARNCRAFAAAVGADKPVEVATYPGVVHAFDNAMIVRRFVSNGHAIEYNADAANDSFRRVQAFLARYDN